MLKIFQLHRWPDNPNDAFKIQQRLKKRVEIQETKSIRSLVTAVDTAYDDNLDRLFAVAVTVSYPGMKEIEKAFAIADADFPYIPALRSFREGPVLLKALSRLENEPDAVIFPGHGIAHPRCFGLASHLGLWLEKPSLGCARKGLVGEYEMPEKSAGDYSPLYIENVVRGVILRSRTGVKPIFISPGHKCGIRETVEIITRCIGEYRMPIPLRLAHLYAAKYRQSTAKKTAFNNGEKRNKRPGRRFHKEIPA